MEVKINKDIREFSESIFFGLSLRQFIFSVIACIVAVVLNVNFLGVKNSDFITATINFSAEANAEFSYVLITCSVSISAATVFTSIPILNSG